MPTDFDRLNTFPGVASWFSTQGPCNPGGSWPVLGKIHKKISLKLKFTQKGYFRCTPQRAICDWSTVSKRRLRTSALTYALTAVNLNSKSLVKEKRTSSGSSEALSTFMIWGRPSAYILQLKGTDTVNQDGIHSLSFTITYKMVAQVTSHECICV